MEDEWAEIQRQASDLNIMSFVEMERYTAKISSSGNLTLKQIIQNMYTNRVTVFFHVLHTFVYFDQEMSGKT